MQMRTADTRQQLSNESYHSSGEPLPILVSSKPSVPRPLTTLAVQHSPTSDRSATFIENSPLGRAPRLREVASSLLRRRYDFSWTSLLFLSLVRTYTQIENMSTTNTAPP
ncbi:uncharacterized protein MYCGRDRAFT_105717, partial [Zymoseptoria tritici IPO323]